MCTDMTEPLFEIINTLFKNSTFSSCFEISVVKPVPKTGQWMKQVTTIQLP
jgi:hypothetical protein